MIKFFDIANADGTITAVCKLEYIQTLLEEFLDKLAIEKATNDMRKKPLPIEWNVRIYNKLESVLTKTETPIANSEAVKLTSNQFYQWYGEYCDLVCYIEEKMQLSYQKNKQEFCSYCAITADAFEMIKKDGDKEQMQALNDIDNKLANVLFVSAERGDIKAKPAEIHLTSKSNIGHKMQTVNNKEIMLPVSISERDFASEYDLKRQIAKMPTPKQLKGKQKNKEQ